MHLQRANSLRMNLIMTKPSKVCLSFEGSCLILKKGGVGLHVDQLCLLSCFKFEDSAVSKISPPTLNPSPHLHTPNKNTAHDFKTETTKVMAPESISQCYPLTDNLLANPHSPDRPHTQTSVGEASSNEDGICGL